MRTKSSFWTKGKLLEIKNMIFLKIENPLRLFISILTIFILIRIIEVLSMCTQTSPMGFVHYLWGIQFDWLFASFIGIMSFPFFLLLPNELPRAWRVTVCGLVLLLGLIGWELSEYYMQIRIPLDHSLLIYPLSEILYIIKASVGVNVSQVVKGVVVVLSSVAIPWAMFTKVSLSNGLKSFLSIIVMVTLLFFHNITPNIARFDSNISYFQQINKTSFLIKQLLLNFNSHQIYADADVERTAKRFQEQVTEFDYLNPTYPFVRRNSDKDVIGDYFAFGENPPNLVFVIVESLSREFSGPNPTMGSFTPFLDSLAQHSLYWSNFLTTSERTFNVLPSSLASLPYGKKGFMALAEDNNPYPDFRSLPSVLKQSGYQSNFFYGGWIDFDFISNFLRAMEVNIALTDKKFTAKYDEIQRTEAGFTWGYPDHAVYLRAMEIIDSLPHQPRMDMYMSLSTHDPFYPPMPDRWEAIFNNYLNQRKLAFKDRAFYEERRSQLTTVLYADNAIKILIDEYSKRPGFENTIFIIYGDHYMPLGTADLIQKYHVPFIVYSPMLKKHVVFPAVSTTADIAPSLLAMLKNRFNTYAPKWLHWLGSPLDTARTYQSKKLIPFMRINRDINEMLWGDYFYSEGRLFRIDENLLLTPVDDNTKLNGMEEMLKDFKILNDYTCTMNTLKAPELNQSK